MGRRQLVRITEPLAMDPRRPVVLGSLLWTVALVTLLLLDLGAEQRWWLWTAVCGVAIGLLGTLAARRSRAQSARAASAAVPPAPTG